VCVPAATAHADDVTDIGSRRELFVDRALVETLSGEATLKLHRPTPQEVVLVTDQPWEGNTCAYYTIFQDGDLYRMYYRGSHWDEVAKKPAHAEVTCYAESRDGVRWTRPKLGLCEFAGSKANNIVWDGVGTHNFTPFKDENPECPPEARYKAFGSGYGQYKRGLYALQSADGIHWRTMSDEPVITQGAFDSQNLAFWDPLRKVYREYHRGFRDGIRDIMTGTSPDFATWTEPEFLSYGDAPREHLYTNAIRPYPRAPHLLLGFPTRFLPEGERVEPTFMASRDGTTFHRWLEPVIPVTAPEDRDGNRSNYMTRGLVQLPDRPHEFSVYATEAYYTGPSSRVRRFTYRLDGFTSLSAPSGGGELLTRPVRFDGRRLLLNARATEGGSVRVEVQDADGTVLSNFSERECVPVTGDRFDTSVAWRSGSDVGGFSAKGVRLRFVVRDADVYSFRFAE
jgi:hypothetical protein